MSRIKEIFEEMGTRLKVAFDGSDLLVQDELRHVHKLLMDLKTEVATFENYSPPINPKNFENSVVEAVVDTVVETDAMRNNDTVKNGKTVLVFAKPDFGATKVFAEVMPSEIKAIRKFLHKMETKHGEIIKIERL
jgi:hypothetical protein